METRREHNAHCVRHEVESKDAMALQSLPGAFAYIAGDQYHLSLQWRKKGKNFVVGTFGYYVCDATVNINKPCSDEGYLQALCKIGLRLYRCKCDCP